MSKVNLSIKLPLKVSREAKAELLTTMHYYTASFNRVAEVAWSQDRVNGNEIHKLTYFSEINQHPLKSQLTISARMKAVEAVKAAKTKLKKRETASCPKSKLCSIRYDARSFRFLKSGVNEVSLGTCDKPVIAYYSIPDYAKDYFDAWKHGSADLVYRKGQFWLHLTVSKEFEFESSGSVVGCDLGVNRPIVTSQNQFLGSKKWKAIDKRYRHVNKSLQAKGTKSAKRKLKARSGRRNRFRNDCDHVLSKQLVKGLTEGTTIVLENLENIRRASERANKRKMSKHVREKIHMWSFARLAGYIGYKAAMNGCSVTYVEPAYSSQECSRCGFIHAESRQRSAYDCVECGFKLNADLNAARVLLNRYRGTVGRADCVGLQSMSHMQGNLQAPSLTTG